MLNFRKNFGPGYIIVIVATFALFTIALFTKGFTRDLLLEAAVFLVSVKLIVMSYRNIDVAESTHQELIQIYETVKRIEATTNQNQSKRQ